MKHSKKPFPNAAKLAIYIALVILSAATVSKESGIVRTIPFILIFPAAATFFYNRKLLTVALSFVSVLIFSLVGMESAAQAVAVSVAATAIAGIGILVKRFFVTAYVRAQKRIFCAVSGVVILVFGAVLHAMFFGNLVSMIKATQANQEYISETYVQNAPKANYTYYNALEKRYFTNVSFIDKSPMNADISADEKIYDGYSNYYEFVRLSARREQLSQLLANHFSSGEYAVRINVSETELFVKPETPPEQLYGGMVFDIAFYAQLTEKADFAEKCRQYAEALEHVGFEYGTINFYGGFADEFIYKMRHDNGFSGDFSENVSDFDGKVFDRYYDELDYAVGWSYGK